MKNLLRYVASAILAASSLAATAQNSQHYGSGLKLSLNPAGDKYVRFILWNQIWAKTNSNNPGTLVNGEESKNTWDIGARRVRMLAYAQITPRYLIVTHFGINNQTFTNGGGSGTSGTGAYGQGKKPQLFFHDAYNEYTVIPAVNAETGDKNKISLAVGGGLHYWNGISRMTNVSTLTFLMIDSPIFSWPLIDVADQFARQFGVYAKGLAGKLHYQVSYNKPFATNLTPTPAANVAVDNNGDPEGAVQGYFDYQFFDQESNLLSYRVGSYLGGKKVFNVGAGFYHQADGTQSSPAVGQTTNHDINLFGVDAFLDMPVGNSAITAYGVYYDYDFGPNYLRNTGIMNTGTTNPNTPAMERVLEGPGNARVLMGTGKIYYAQAGLLLPKFGEADKVRLQPIASLAHKRMEALNEAGNFWDVGCNFLLDSHNAKITGQYSSRPLFDATSKTIKDRKGEFLVQLQIVL